MRYDDPQRPKTEIGGSEYLLHLSGAPMPSITLVRPMESEHGGQWVWGWLCCIHAARGQNAYSHYYGWVQDLGHLSQWFFEDPEAALLHYFKWGGMVKSEALKAGKPQQVIEEDIFAE